jgi:hypothetical protein
MKIFKNMLLVVGLAVLMAVVILAGIPHVHANTGSRVASLNVQNVFVGDPNNRLVPSSMAACDEATINVDWQFNVNAWEGQAGPAESPLLLGVDSFYLYRHYDIATQRMALNYPEADHDAIEALTYGQGHNPPAQQTYRDCAAQRGIYPFFRLVVSAAPGRRSNFAEARNNLSWQVGANPESINNAHNSWLSAQNVTNAQAKDYFMVQAMWFLMMGQHHNAGVMQLYRACFRDDPDQLFKMVTFLDLRNPEQKLQEIMRAKKSTGDR